MRLQHLPAVLALVACSGSPADVPDPKEQADCGPACEPEGHAKGEPTPPDAGPADADADAGVDACVPPPLASTAQVSRSCKLMGACPTCADGQRWRCNPWIGTAQPGLWSQTKPFDPPPAPGCRQLDDNGADGDSDFCCPLTCVRQADSDTSCAGEHKAVVCPSGSDNLPLLPAPKGCSYPAPLTPVQHLMCCR